MQITHLGHACVLVESAGTRVLLDPGNFTDDWHGVERLDAIIATHQHPDHFDPEHVPALVAANPAAVVLLEAELAERAGVEATPLHPGDEVGVGGLTVRAVGGRHAIIHPDIPGVGNVGVLLSAPGEPTFFHPGDALDQTPEGVDVVAVPAHGPWAAMKEHIDFIRALGAGHGFMVHDGLLSERGLGLAWNRYREMTSTEFDDLRDHQPREYRA